jgi:hypothetical protein
MSSVAAVFHWYEATRAGTEVVTVPVAAPWRHFHGQNPPLPVRMTVKVVMATGTSTVPGRAPDPTGGASSEDRGVVVGGIWPCDALVTRPLSFVGGTVAVLQGAVRLAPLEKGVSRTVLPRHLVAVQTVSASHEYRFDLPPSKYVLKLLRYSNGPLPPLAFVSVTVVSGRTVKANIPDVCF